MTSYHSATSSSWSLSSVRRNELELNLNIPYINSKVEVAWTFFLSPKVCVIAVRIHKQASYFVTELVLYLLKKTRDEKKNLLATSQHLLDRRGWAYDAQRKKRYESNVGLFNEWFKVICFKVRRETHWKQLINWTRKRKFSLPLFGP